MQSTLTNLKSSIYLKVTDEISTYYKTNDIIKLRNSDYTRSLCLLKGSKGILFLA